MRGAVYGGEYVNRFITVHGGEGCSERGREGEKEREKEGEREVEDTCQYVQHIHCMTSLQAQTHTNTHTQYNTQHHTQHNNTVTKTY